MADPSAPLPAAGGTAPESFEQRVTRRKFIVNVGWGLVAAFGAGFAGVLNRYLFPNVLYEPASLFKAGKPSDYPTPNTVSEKWLKDFRTWLIRDDHGIYAVWARCTHLGCTPRWFSNEHRFRCPCHGSNYNIKAEVIAGPAPRPMYRCKVWLDDEGVINVDKGVGVLLSTTNDKLRLNPPYYIKVS